MGGFSLWHILIFAIILLLLFGGNRFSAMMGDVAKGLKSFKQGMAEEDEQQQGADAASGRARARSRRSSPIDITPPARARRSAAPPPPRDDTAL